MEFAMPDGIQFPEALGVRPVPSAAEYAAIATAPGLRDAQRNALPDGDPAAISELLEARPGMKFVISSPSPDDHGATPEEEHEDDYGPPDNEEQPRG